MLTCRDLRDGDLQELLGRYGLVLVQVPDDEPIPGSYWGEPEAGIISDSVFVRADTPVHSALHEACHLIVKPAQERVDLHTDASDSIDEEDATCYLQIVLSDDLEGVGRDRLMADMDEWGYSFRLGSASAWFATDAGNARDWLRERLLLDPDGHPVLPDSIAPCGASTDAKVSDFIPPPPGEGPRGEEERLRTIGPRDDERHRHAGRWPERVLRSASPDRAASSDPLPNPRPGLRA